MSKGGEEESLRKGGEDRRRGRDEWSGEKDDNMRGGEERSRGEGGEGRKGGDKEWKRSGLY